MHFTQILQTTKNFNVLYVEDDEAIALQIQQLLNIFFKTVFYAKDGREGYKLFSSKNPDLIITDIKMPNMNGIEMSKQIRLLSKDVPIIIISAHEESSLLHESIRLGVVSYITKPIEQQSLTDVICNVCQNLENKKLAEQHIKNSLIKELELKEQNTILQLIDVIEAPILIAEDETILYVNNAFKNMFTIENIKLLHENKTLDFLNNFIIAGKSGYKDKISDIEINSASKMILSLPKTKFYEVHRKKLFECDALDKKIMYMFYDITKIESSYIAIEYHKNKLKCANNLLSEFFYKNSYKKIDNTKEAISEYSTILTDEQKDILSKSRSGNTLSAKEYVKELDGDIKEEIALLKDIEHEIAVALDSFLCLKSYESLVYSVKLLKDYASQIYLLIEFGDLAVAIKGLALFILELSEEAIELNGKKLSFILGSILDDLIAWRKNIFEEQTANDIHYLDASLFSSCLQLQFDISEQKLQNDTDDLGLELF